MDLLAFIAYLWLALLQVWQGGFEHPNHPDSDDARPDKSQNDEIVAEAATVFFSNQNLERGRVIFEGALAAAVYEQLSDALLQRVEALPDGQQVTIKSSPFLSCYEFLQPTDSRRYQCLYFLNRQGQAFQGWQAPLQEPSAAALSEGEASLGVMVTGSVAEQIFDHLEVLTFEAGAGDGAERRRRGQNLVCIERLDSGFPPHERFVCRQLITKRGLLAPFGTNDPIARVGRLIEPEPGMGGEAKLGWQGAETRFQFELGLADLASYQVDLEADDDSGSDGNVDSDEPDFPFPEF